MEASSELNHDGEILRRSRKVLWHEQKEYLVRCTDQVYHESATGLRKVWLASSRTEMVRPCAL